MTHCNLFSRKSSCHFLDLSRPNLSLHKSNPRPGDYHRKIWLEKQRKVHIRFISTGLRTLFYDRIFDYISNHFWLYHPAMILVTLTTLLIACENPLANLTICTNNHAIEPDGFQTFWCVCINQIVGFHVCLNHDVRSCRLLWRIRIAWDAVFARVSEPKSSKS